jgi:glycosyltransferase involved in cell wall biosynthesis
MPAPSINLVAFENGVGNSRDVVLLSNALRELGCTVNLTIASVGARRRRKLRLVRAACAGRHWLSQRQQSRGQPTRFDLTVMLEHVWPEQLHLARRNVLVPNPEFCDRHDRSMLRYFDCVWAKTRNTQEIFTRLGHACCLIGFDSVDRHAAEIAPGPGFLHLAGKSRMKGTARLTSLWARHPEWPLLTVSQSLRRAAAPVRAANILYRTDFLHDPELQQLQNRHVWHVCTSETEGWGHYIVEAQSIGAVVLATDAPPMNELVTADRGLLVRSAAVGRQHLATTYEFDCSEFERAVDAALGMDAARRAQLGAAARDWYWENKRGFPQRLVRALEIV